MGTEIDDLVALFVGKLRQDGVLVQAPAPGENRLVVDHCGQRVTIVLPERALRGLLDEGDELAADLWGPSVTAAEAAARLMTIHLEESLQVQADDRLEGSWVYNGGSFVRTPTPRA